MVYPGRPSRGCHLCKKRKIKCDEARPACYRCTSTKRPCPGYVDRFDLVLRDQTDLVRSRAERKTQQKGHHHQENPPHVDGAISRFDEPLLLSPPLAESPEVFALCIFFTQFVLVPIHPDGQRGFLECLPPLYNVTRHGSLLSVAASAVALTISGGAPTRRAHFCLGRYAFGKALRMASVAIQDPVASTEDETLMAVLLLAFYERVNSAIKASNTTGTHEAGASALIRHRGEHNSRSELSTKLSLAVHVQIVEAAGQKDPSTMTASVNLPQLGADLPRNTASRLTPISAQVTNLRGYADRVLQRSSPCSAWEIDQVLQMAHQVDAKLQEWADTVPQTWSYCPATGIQCPIDVPREAFVYQDRMDFYEDVNMANVWNTYRTNRIWVHRVILACLARQDFHLKMHEVVQSARQTTQELVDDICASVPFHLGTKMLGDTRDRDEVQYPHRDGSYLGRAQRQACAAFGGWYLIDVLKTCLTVEGLRQGQKEWIRGQMKRIGILYSFEWAAHLGGMEKEKLQASEWDNQVLSACMPVRRKEAL